MKGWEQREIIRHLHINHGLAFHDIASIISDNPKHGIRISKEWVRKVLIKMGEKPLSLSEQFKIRKQVAKQEAPKMKGMLRYKVKYIIVHSSATKPSQNVTVQSIRSDHLQRGFSDIGYHYVIDRRGFLFPGRDLEYQGAHTYDKKNKISYNNNIGVCLIGGLSEQGKAEFNFTWPQMDKLMHIIFKLKLDYSSIQGVVGHRDLVQTECPSFNVKEFFRCN